MDHQDPNCCRTDCIQNVYCDVKNCVHHDGKQYCCAEHIKVGPTYAVSSSDTACATFQSK